MKLHYGDLTDSSSLVKIICEVKPTEIYNLGAQSHVKASSESSNLLYCLKNFPILFVNFRLLLVVKCSVFSKDPIFIYFLYI